MLKNMVNLNGIQNLDKEQQKTINGGIDTFSTRRGPICRVGPFTIDCSTNTDGRCTCVNGRCIQGPSSDCR